MTTFGFKGASRAAGAAGSLIVPRTVNLFRTVSMWHNCVVEMIVIVVVYVGVFGVSCYFKGFA